MSHASGKVRFNDGTIMHYEYDGTSDWVIPKLYDTHEEMWDNWRKYEYQEIHCEHKLEDIEIYSDYGNGFYWKGKACRKCNMVIEGRSLDHIDDFIQYGKPKWA